MCVFGGFFLLNQFVIMMGGEGEGAHFYPVEQYKNCFRKIAEIMIHLHAPHLSLISSTIFFQNFLKIFTQKKNDPT